MATAPLQPAGPHHVTLLVERLLDVTVHGTPATQGSKQPFNDAAGHPRVREDNKDLKRWRSQVAQVVGEAWPHGVLDEALGLAITFYRPRPSTHYRKDGNLNAHGLRHPYPDMAPDLTKLERAVEDALHDVCFTNDARIVEKRTRKRWGPSASCRIILTRLLPNGPTG